MSELRNGLDGAKAVLLGLLVIGLIGLLFLIIYGNLSTNLGFASGTQGFNDTEAVIGNLTGGAVQFFSFSNVWFVLGAVALLIAIVMGIIFMVIKLSGKTQGGFSN